MGRGTGMGTFTPICTHESYLFHCLYKAANGRLYSFKTQKEKKTKSVFWLVLNQPSCNYAIFSATRHKHQPEKLRPSPRQHLAFSSSPLLVEWMQIFTFLSELMKKQKECVWNQSWWWLTPGGSCCSNAGYDWFWFLLLWILKVSRLWCRHNKCSGDFNVNSHEKTRWNGCNQLNLILTSQKGEI